MITVSEAFKSWLISCIGLRLRLALGLFHVFESEKNNSPQAVSLFFDGQGVGTLECAPDGASIAYSSDAVFECDLGDDLFVYKEIPAEIVRCQGLMFVRLSLM
ncbi:hypothetical protein ACIOUF_02330 [Pseudomonas iridis]|uniref:Uncharacterized protein n=1 Tax=Pseudomonas iridis TaxID=2710587 RepID=A0ABW8DD98_9PSED